MSHKYCDCNECIPAVAERPGDDKLLKQPIKLMERPMETFLFTPEEEVVADFCDRFLTKDSGQRQHFESGMVRDTQAGKVDYTRIIEGPMFDRWAELLTRAETKYPDIKPGVANWTLANGEEELVRFKKSAFRHFRQWIRGDQDEDHAAATYFNINGYEYVKAKLREANS